MGDQLIDLLSNFGGYAVLAGVLLWNTIRTTDKLTSIIQSNTRAMVELKNIIERMEDRLGK